MRPEQSGRVDWPICRPLGAARRQVVSRQPRWRRLDLVVVQLPGRWRPIAGNRSKVPIPICENGWPTGPDGCELAGEILSVRRALGSTVHLAAGGRGGVLSGRRRASITRWRAPPVGDERGDP